MTAVVTSLANGSLFSPVFCISRIRVSCILVGTSSLIAGLGVVVAVVVVKDRLVVVVVEVVVEGSGKLFN